MVVKKSTKTVDKSIYFTLLLYPENLPADWKIQLETTGRPIAISPVHDKDLTSISTLKKTLRREELYFADNRNMFDSEQKQSCYERMDYLKRAIDGQEKIYLKPHYHVIYVAKNPVTADSVRKKLQKILGFECVAQVKIIATSVRNMYDYLTHESIDAIAKNKHIYPKDEIVLLNNFDIDRYDELDAADKKEALNKVIDIIKLNDIPNMIELEFFIDEHGSELGITTNVLRTVIDGKAGLLRLYFDGVYQRSKRESTDLKKENEEYFKLAQRQMQEIIVLKRKLEDKEK